MQSKIACMLKQILNYQYTGFINKDNISKYHRSLTEDNKNVKTLCGPLFGSKATTHMIKCRYFLLTLSL